MAIRGSTGIFYYSQRGERLLLLLAGGDKSTQQRDVSLAVKLAKNIRD
jgi:putative addiction module killer protein